MDVSIYKKGVCELGNLIFLDSLLIAFKAIYFVIEGIEEYIGVTIISNQSNELRMCIIEKLERGCIIYNGKNGYSKRVERLKEVDIIYTLITCL